MDDLISRAAAIDALEEQLDYLHKLNKDENPTAESNWYGVNWARNTIADLPSADRRGQWKEVGTFTDDKGITTHVLNCLECGALHRVRKLWTGEYVNANFCPNCGADMRRGDSE